MIGSYWRIVIRPNLRNIVLIGVLSLLAAVAEVASIGMVIPVVTLFSVGESTTGQKFVLILEAIARNVGLSPNPSRLLFLALLGVTLFIVLKVLLILALNCVTAFVSQDTKRQLTLRMFTAYAHARYSELVRRGRGSIIQDIQKPPDTIGYVVYYLGLSVAAGGQLVLTLGFLTWLSPALTLVILAIGLTTVYVSRHYLHERMAKLGGSDYSLDQAGAGLVVDAIDGVRIVKVHNLVGRLRTRLEEVLAGHVKIAVRQLLFQQVPRIGFELVGVLTVVLLIALSQGVPALGLDFPALAAFVLALRQVTPVASTLNVNLLNMSQHWRQIQVVEEVLATMPQEDDNRGTVPLPPVIHTLRLEAVTFAYPENPTRCVFQDLSLTLSRGRVTALVGATGAGKTTIANFILRLQEPLSGKLLANDIDIRQFSLEEWRGQIGYVGQDVFLFHATLRENIAAYDDSVSQADIVRATQLSQIHEFIATLPDGYQTHVGDRGVKLSGGQRQRIAVARAILKRPKILILDEATSALDSLTEQALHSAIDFIRHEAIVILIAHRLSTVEDADEILVLHSGRIVERGSHKGLLAKRELYWELYGAAHKTS